ncbi:hypothetical protein P5673_015050 [Acropora cervicornis]|uniref:EAL domain-containing protein n=1 Tax=Acropora cervicornis TaxID=6130 RepID=A0AAD9V574_ACRCE|nr:hypothetical protein P5673_015050 [Acropora cervicornis]
MTLKAVLDEVEAEISAGTIRFTTVESTYTSLNQSGRSQTGRLENGGFKFGIDSYGLGYEIFTVEVSTKAM